MLIHEQVFIECRRDSSNLPEKIEVRSVSATEAQFLKRLMSRGQCEKSLVLNVAVGICLLTLTIHRWYPT